MTLNFWKRLNVWLFGAPPAVGQISPIDVATQGTLNSPLSVAAVRGMLIIPVAIAVLRGGDSSKPRLLMPDEQLDRQLKREDEEILAIIVSIMEVIDE